MENIPVAQAIISSLFASERALKLLFPNYNWAVSGNVLGDMGELLAIAHYNLKEVPNGTKDYDALTQDNKTVQIKTNRHAKMIAFRGEADLLLVLHINDDGNWTTLYYGDFAIIKKNCNYGARDNKYSITLTKLKKIKN